MEDPCYRALRTAADCIARLERDHATVRANMAAGQQPTLSTGVPTADPDGNVTWTRVEADGNMRIHLGIGRYQMLIEHALVNLLEADLMRGANVTANMVAEVNMAEEAKRIRCDGWDDPTCENFKVNTNDIWIDGHAYQLCQRCWDRYRQQKHRETAR